MTTNRVKMFLLAGLGAGYLPGAPGTWASAAAVLIWLAGAHLCGLVGERTSLGYDGAAILLNVLTLAGAAGATAVCIAFGPIAIASAGDHDPGFVVADEFAGQWIALVGAGSLLSPWMAAIVAFVLFRLFDITKPWPCRRLERMPGGYGIVADDIMAGVYAQFLGLIVSFVLGMVLLIWAAPSSGL